MDLNRLVEVCPADIPLVSAKSNGTGYLVSSRLVLTVGHALTTTRNDIKQLHELHWIRLRGRSWNDKAAQLVWHNRQLDLALLCFSQADAPVQELSPALLGRLPLREKVDCRAVGYPSFVDSLAGTRKLSIEAVIDPDSGQGPPEMVLKINAGQPLPREASGWKGYSGTPIFAEEFLVGVVVLTAKAADGLLYGAEIAGLFEDEKFCEALVDGGCSVPTAAGLPIVLGEKSSQFAQLVEQYPLRRVSDVDCYDVLGVKRSEFVDQYRDKGKDPPYVPRDIDEKLREAQRRKSFVLLVGPQKAGKSRSAYEALRKIAPSKEIVIPKREEDLARLVEKARALGFRSGVLWLDELDRFLTQRSFDVHVFREVVVELEMQIVATMASREFARWMDDPLGRDAQAVFERAEVIKLEDTMTTTEKELAQAIYPNLKLSQGLGESFIAGRRLVLKYDHGTSSLVAIVRAANDWRRAGLTAPISRDDLFKLFKRHFKDLERNKAADENLFDEGLANAIEPVARYRALLNRQDLATGDPGFVLGDYVSEFLEEKGQTMLEEVWPLALSRAESAADYQAIGLAALTRKYPEVAAKAWTLGLQKGSGLTAYSLALLLHHSGQFQESEIAYQKAISLGFTRPQAFHNLGGLLRRQHREDEAEKAYRDAILADPNYAIAHYSLGLLLVGEERYEEAERAFRDAIRIEPSYADAHNNLGNLLVKKKKLKDAEHEFRLAIRANPRNSSAHCGLGRLLNSLGNIRGAEKHYRAAIRGDPKNADAYFSLGVLLDTQHRIRAAKRAYQSAIRADPECALYHYNLAVLLEAENQSEAEKEYLDAIRLDEKDVAALNDLGVLYFKQELYEKAKEAFSRAVLMDPDDPLVQNNLGNLFDVQGDPGKAEEAYRNALRAKPDLAEAHHNLGLLRREQKLFEEAEAHYREAERIYRETLRINPDDQDVRSKLEDLLSGQRFTDPKNSGTGT